MKNLSHLDLRQHFREWSQFILPIGVLVTAIILIFLAVAQHLAKNAANLGNVKPAPVGLVPAGSEMVDPAFLTLSPIEMVSAPLAADWDAPLGSEHGGLAYNAQPFLTDKHLGDDLNGIGGWNSDLGDSVYAAADGLVVYAGWPSDGWGNVVVLLHEIPDGRMIESFYGHLDSIRTGVGSQVRRGDEIGTVGTADDNYLAHLHFEIRRAPVLATGGGYADTGLDRLSGERSLLTWRNRKDDQLAGPPKASSPDEVLLDVDSGPGE